ncbi:MAG: DUF2147 domain-containing protein [Burkholderiales bacterium]|jgi:uncharacterized protein (DUF2147 family)
MFSRIVLADICRVTLGWVLAMAAALSPAQAQGQAQAQASPVGLWRTMDESSGQAKALVRIEERNGTLVGRIERLLVDPESATCQACTGELKGKPVIGLTILNGLRREGELWSGGEVLDPNNGKFYKAQVRLAQAGEQLQVRGYVGVPSMGRTQTWRRER